MKRALITGANKSIGFETARQLLKNGFYVYLGSRDLKNGQEALEKLKAEGLTQAEVIQLNVADQQSVNDARAEIGRKTDVLDVLINNAGVNGGIPQSALGLNLENMKEAFNVNVFGVVRVTQAFFGLMEKSAAPRIVNVSSSGCSLTLSSDPEWRFYDHKAAIYQPSKAAMNMYTIDLAYELRNTNFKVNAVDPGFTATDFNNHRGDDSAENAGIRIAKYALIGEEGPNGKFISEYHDPKTGNIPW